MKNRPLIAVLFAAAAVAVIAAGCGSSKSTTSAITKADFLKKGNAICASGTKQINAAGSKIIGTNPNQKPSPEQIRKFATTVLIPSVQSQVDAVRALGAPKGDEATVKAITDAAQQGIDKAKQDPASLGRTKGPGPFAKANALAKAYGLTACGGG